MGIKHFNLATTLAQILHGESNLTIADLDKIESPEDQEIVYGLICLSEDLEFNRKRKDKVIANLKLALFETTILAVTDLEGKFKEVNTQFIKLSGYEEDELLGTTFEFLNSDYLKTPYFNDLWATINKGKVWQGEFRNVNKSGDYFWIDTSIIPIKNENDQLVEFWSLSTDITERVTSKILSESIAKELRQFIETANAPIFGIDSKGMINEWNKTIEKITGFKKSEVLGEDLIATYITEDYQKKVKKVFDNALKGEETANYEFPLFTKDGNRLMVLLNSSTRRDIVGNITGVLGVGQDITEMVRQKDLLRTTKDRLELVLGSLNECVWGRTMPDYQMQYISNSAVSMYGFPIADWHENPNLWSDAIHPDDIKRVNIENENLFSKGASTLEYRIITADKKIKWITSETRIAKSTDGTPYFMTGIARDITQLKQAKKELAISEKQYRELFENSANAELILKNNVFVECNDATLEMLGYKNAKEFLIKQLLELSPEKQPDGQLSSEKSKKMNDIAYDTGSNRFEWTHLKSNGDAFPVEVLLTPITSENVNDKTLHVVWRDITDQKKAQDQLNQLNNSLVEKSDKLQLSNVTLQQNIAEMDALRTVSESVAKELRRFIDTANAPIFGIDSKGLVNEWNKTTENITGFKKEEVLGNTSIETYIPENYRNSVKLVLGAALKGKETANYEFSLFTKDGNRVMVLLNASTRRNPEGKIVGVIGVGQDITTVNKYKENLEKTLLNLEEKNLDLERFAFVAAHDLKSPLIGINGLSQLLSKNYSSQLDNEGKEMLSLLSKASDRLRNLIDGLLEYSRCENVLKENKSQVNINSLMDDLTGLFIYENRLTLKLKASITNITINRAALDQVLINLITNAIKYNDKKKVEIEIGVSASTTHYEFYVQDNGPGIALEYQEKIFNIFEVLLNKDRFGVKGNGIGLASVKKVIENSGGSIKIKSELTKGANFIFTFEK